MSEEQPNYGNDYDTSWRPRPGTLLRPDESGYVRADKNDLREFMKARGLTGGMAAKIAGVDARTIRKWTGGERNFPYSAWATLLISTGDLSPPRPDYEHIKLYFEDGNSYMVNLNSLYQCMFLDGEDFNVTGWPVARDGNARSSQSGAWESRWVFHDGDRFTIMLRRIGDEFGEFEVVVDGLHRTVLKEGVGFSGLKNVDSGLRPTNSAE